MTWPPARSSRSSRWARSRPPGWLDPALNPTLNNLATGKEFPLKPLGEVPPAWIAKPYP